MHSIRRLVLTVNRKIAASREQQRKDRDREEAENGYAGTADYDDDEMDMQSTHALSNSCS